MAGAGLDLRRSGAVALAFAMAGLAFAIAASQCFAQPGRMHQVIELESNRRADRPPATRWEADPGDFVLDRTTPPRPLMRFDSSPEIWVLQPTPGPRGDVIYKSDTGRTLLRATMVGGMTVFPLERPDGSAAAFSGPSAPIRPQQVIGPSTLFNRLAAASVRASRAAQHLISMEAPDYNPDSAWLAADAALVASEAMVRLATTPNGRRYMARIGEINIIDGRRPAASLANGVLTLTIVSNMGFAGRPSSDRIIQVVTR
jgi:hypothetical protein